MSVDQLLSHIQSLSETLENASSLTEDLMGRCQASNADSLSIKDIGEMWGKGQGLHVDGTVTIKDYMEMAATQLENIEDLLR